MAKYRFVATHGVEFSDENGVWAKFVRDPALDTDEGEKRYVLETDDPKVAARVRKVGDYGITEDKSSEG